MKLGIGLTPFHRKHTEKKEGTKNTKERKIISAKIDSCEIFKIELFTKITFKCQLLTKVS